MRIIPSENDGLYKIFIQIFVVIAEFERDTLTERIVDNMMELAKDGRWLGGNTPMDNAERIQKKANKIYEMVITNRKQKLTDNSCSFSILEQGYQEYVENVLR